jgi:hypothetical protein
MEWKNIAQDHLDNIEQYLADLKNISKFEFLV